MLEQSTENAFSTDNGTIKTEQQRSESGDRLNQEHIANNIIFAVNQLSKQIMDLDKKSTRTEELISSIKKDIKNAVMTMEKTNHQIASDDSARIKEFHDEIIHLQSQTQNIQQAINDVYKSKKSKNDKKSKKKSKSMKNKKQK
jgi:hypothetical protein